MQAWVIGNWKQNPATINEVDTLLNDLIAALSADNNVSDNTASDKQATDNTIDTLAHCQLMVAPSSVHINSAAVRLQDSAIQCAAQDISAHSSSTGAYTGDCSAQQVHDAGATWTLLGHSERRQYHQESHATLVNKLTHALTKNLGVVFCIGETQAQYDAKQTFAVLDTQLSVLQDMLNQAADIDINITTNLAKRLIIAYEPVWAIGTGKVPTVSEVSATHQHIKQIVAKFSDSLSAVQVLYGGSVNADNADSFAASPMIDGALVGGASLKAQSFLMIAQAFSRAKAHV